MIIDAHQHFWDPDRLDYPWMTNEVEPIRRAFGPADLEPILTERNVSYSVVVQATSGIEETRYLQDIAASTSFVAGVVGWIDLTAPSASEALEQLRSERGGEYLVGIRHQVHDEADPEWLTRTDVQPGLRDLGRAGLAYDFLVRARELPAALVTARAHPDVRFVIDHIAKPPIAEGAFEKWGEAMQRLSALDNVYCKLSGMVTEADTRRSLPAQLTPYIHRVLEWFGDDRLMFGSDWPVCLLAATYGEVMDVLDNGLGDLSTDSRAKIYGRNAAMFYGLKLGDEA